MSNNWIIVGHYYNNDEVANALNKATIGVGACVGLNIQKTQFTVWGDDKSTIFPGYAWKCIGGGSSEDAITDAANSTGAASTAVTVNANGDWVLWGYVPS